MFVKAAQFANKAHNGQIRKYTGRPYIEHPMRVAGQVSLAQGVSIYTVCAAWLHDVIEDCDVTLGRIRCVFGTTVAGLVEELTNPSKQHLHLDLPRALRKATDREHLAKVSYWAKIIKLHDRIDNIRDMQDAPKSFKQLYGQETLALCDVFTDPDYEIRILVRELRCEVARLVPELPVDLTEAL